MFNHEQFPNWRNNYAKAIEQFVAISHCILHSRNKIAEEKINKNQSPIDKPEIKNMPKDYTDKNVSEFSYNDIIMIAKQMNEFVVTI